MTLLIESVLHLTLSKQGGMGMDYNGEHLGQYGGAATKPIIEACLLNYLAGKKVASEGLRNSFVTAIIQNLGD